MQATPRNAFVGGLADFLAAGTSPQRTQQMRGLMEFLQVPDIAQTLDRVSYGEPLTTGRGMTTKLRPEAESTLMAALGMLPAGRPAEAGTMALGRAGERMAERVVPQVMERGGLPAEMLGAMAQGSRSKMFIGPDAKTWDQKAAIKAANMERKGATPQEIWSETGTARGPDKMWRQEISDKPSTMKGSGDFEKTIMSAYERGSQRTGDQLYKTNVGDVLFHHELAQAYPELMSIETQMLPKSRTARGSLIKTSDGQVLRVKEDLPSQDARSTMMHELQHAIQEQERFAVGGNTRDFARMRQEADDKIAILNDQMRSLVREMDNPATTATKKSELKSQYENLMSQRQALVPAAQIDPMEAYGHLMGEAEARLTQRRLNLTPEERRQNFPFQYTGETGFGFDVDPTRMILMTPEGQIKERGLLGNLGR
jgi:hypothetical protein